MDPGKISAFLRQIVTALARCILVAVVLPLVPVLFFGVPLAPVLSVISSGFLIEYGAAPIGLALGLSPLVVFFILMCTETGIFLGLYDIFNTVGETSPAVARFLEKTHQYSRSSVNVERYGILALVPCEILLGVYICAPVSWVLGWDEKRALIVTIAGYIPALVITILLTLGLFGVILP
jgi:hypothetical protein